MTTEEMKEIRDYKNFMNEPKNIGNCANCPENRGFDSWQGKRPCGQYNCWVKIHCRED